MYTRQKLENYYELLLILLFTSLAFFMLTFNPLYIIPIFISNICLEKTKNKLNLYYGSREEEYF